MNARARIMLLPEPLPVPEDQARPQLPVLVGEQRGHPLVEKFVCARNLARAAVLGEVGGKQYWSDSRWSDRCSVQHDVWPFVDARSFEPVVSDDGVELGGFDVALDDARVVEPGVGVGNSGNDKAVVHAKALKVGGRRDVEAPVSAVV